MGGWRTAVRTCVAAGGAGGPPLCPPCPALCPCPARFAVKLCAPPRRGVGGGRRSRSRAVTGAGIHRTAMASSALPSPVQGQEMQRGAGVRGERRSRGWGSGEPLGSLLGDGRIGNAHGRVLQPSSKTLKRNPPNLCSSHLCVISVYIGQALRFPSEKDQGLFLS